MIHLLFLYSGSNRSELILKELSETNYRVWRADSKEDVHALLDRYPISVCITEDEKSAELLGACNSEGLSAMPILICDDRRSPHAQAAWHLQLPLTDRFYGPVQARLLKPKIRFLNTVSGLANELDQSHQEISNLHKKIAELHKSLEGHNSFLELMSRRDGLTGLFNRRYFNECIREYFHDRSNCQDDLALLILNIDYFDEINRTCGQEYGDGVLNQFSARITGSTHEPEVCFRLSGEDFAVLIPSASEKHALARAEDLRHACAEKPFEIGSISRDVTVTIGIATMLTHRPRSHEELINMANQAMFKAKSEGRNRCLTYTPIDRSSFGTSDENFKILQNNVSRILEKTKQSTIQSLQLLAQSVLDNVELEKTRQAQEYVQLLSERMFFPKHLIETFQNAFTLLGSIRYLLHNEIISRKRALSTSEMETLADLPYKLAEITELFDYFSGERTLLLYHGERFDGTGYPEGLKGEEIPIGARILSLISAFAAMDCDRPYRSRLSPEQILAELAENAGKQFDPDLVLKLIDIIEEKSILEVSAENLEKARMKVHAIN